MQKTHRHGSMLAVGIVALLLTGCATPTVFVPTDSQFTMRPGSLAVMCGLGSELSIAFADEVEQGLRARGRFAVLERGKITEKFRSYPANIIDAEGEFSESDRPKFDRIQKALGVEYILVVWIYDQTTYTDSRFPGRAGYRFNIGARLLDYPGSRVAGLSSFAYEMGGSQSDEDEIFRKMIAQSSESLVQEFLKKANMARAE